MLWRFTTSDARGEVVPLRRLTDSWWRRQLPWALPTDTYLRIRTMLIESVSDEELRSTARNRWISAVLAVCFAALAITLLISSGRLLDWLFMTGFSLIALHRLYRACRQPLPLLDTTATVRAWLFVELCPSCNFSLKDAARSETGSAICAECGSHWTLPTAAPA